MGPNVTSKHSPILHSAEELVTSLNLAQAPLCADTLNKLLAKRSQAVRGTASDLTLTPLASYFLLMSADSKLRYTIERVSKIGDYEALACLWDGIRTDRFVAAIAKTLQALESRYHNYTIIDAGCGPVPVLALAAAAYSKRAKVIAIESNSNSFAIAQRIIERQQLTQRISLVHADASKISITPQSPVRLIISETTNLGLTGEPMVEIFKHLKRLFPDAITIPHEVQVWTSLKFRPFAAELQTAKRHARTSHKLRYHPGQDLNEINLAIRAPPSKGPIAANLCLNSMFFLDQHGSRLSSDDSHLTKPFSIRLPGQEHHFEILEPDKNLIQVRYKPGQRLQTIKARLENMQH